MNKTKYNQLREEIIKANKDILALKFGCKVSIPELKNNIAVIVHKERCEKTSKDFVNVVFPYDWNTDTYFVEDIKIIGRDITLEDCLIAGFKSLPKMNLGNPKNAEIYKKYEKFVTDVTLQESQWKPNKPPQDQSGSTINLLWDLIVK